MVIAKGPDTLSLRAVADAAGATATAPYAFFKGGATELLAAVATTGFLDLIDALGTASDTAGNPVIDIVERYVRFGVKRGNLYRSMFHTSLAKPLSAFESGAPEEMRGFETYQELYALKMTAFEAIIDAVRALAPARSLRGGDEEDGALAVAALAHGLVGEFIDEGLGLRDVLEDPWSPSRQQMTRRVTEILIHGLVE
jgi:AcrR family transcriptional regulator